MSDTEQDAGTEAGSASRLQSHFPAARIKKLMQADDEIGKVASATPAVAGRALELFLASLVDACVAEARSRGQSRVTPDTLAAAVAAHDSFDFLEDVVRTPQ